MKRLKILLGALLLAVVVVGSFAFTSGRYHKASDIRCFEFIPGTPDASNVLVQGNYDNASPTNGCTNPRQEYCAVCFDIDENPDYVTEDGDNLKLNTANANVSAAISAKWNVISQGQTQNGITFHYKPF